MIENNTKTNKEEQVIKFLKTLLSKKQRLRLRSIYGKLFCRDDLKKLSLLYGTDKWGIHYYAQHYETHFRHLRNKKLNILEIGIGGYNDTEGGGGSLRAWRTFFPNSTIYGLDIYDKKFHEEKRIKTFICSQDDPVSLKEVATKIGNIDIIIDDGSHINSHVIKTFHTLFPLLNQNGIYIVEDTQTSYREEIGGNSQDFNLNTTSMGFFKSLVDGINYEEYPGDYQPNYYDKNIIAIHFYHNMVFISKGENNEGSNLKK
jgi:hypothetical protein